MPGDGTSRAVVGLAVAAWCGSEPGEWTGYDLASGRFDDRDLLLVGTPNADPSRLTALTVGELGFVGAWIDRDPEGSSASSSFGESIALLADTRFVAVGASDGANGPAQDGVVYVFESLPDGRVPVEDPRLVIYGDLHHRASLGTKVLYIDPSGGGVDLVVGTGNTEPDLESAIFRFPLGLTGERGVDAATAAIWGGPYLGQYIAGWDSDGDGLVEVVTSVESGAAHFPAPWIGDIAEVDADVVFAERDPVDQFGTTLEPLGDLDGDGGAELAIGANTYGGAVERGGGLWLVPSGPITSVPGDELPYAFLGTSLGEGVGDAAETGDYDGDGAADLVVGAPGFVPGKHPGSLLGYLGPLAPGTRTAGDADFRVDGEAVYDWFGSAALTVDADGDPQDDLVVSAQGWNLRGKVYLLLGADLVP